MSNAVKNEISVVKNEISPVDENSSEPLHKREKWSRKIDFLLACIGFSVGLGNVWRFPYLCYRNGGGAFLIPYFLCVIIGGVPLFFLEVAVGQFTGTTGLKAWRLCPILQGLGLTSFVIVVFLNIYYNVILCWSFRYMFASFTTGPLPWSECGNEWNTCHCRSSTGENILNNTLCNITEAGNSDNVTTYDSVTEYWEREVLQISSGLHDMGILKWDLVLCLLFAWIVVYICICKGIKSSGKVMYVTATSPYIFMIILLIRGCLLPGAKEGIIFYLKPSFERLLDIQVWVDAGSQIFFSYSISLGALTALGSYNVFNHNCFRDSIIFSITNSGTSLLAGFITFPVLGYMAKQQNKTISDVAESGPGMAFIAYPQAVATMPAAPFWSILFFLMLILLGMDSQFVGVEAVVTLIVDQFPKQLRRGYRKEIFTGCVCMASFLLGLPMCMNGGMYVFQIFDFYAASRIILLVGGLECIAISWIYGVNRFYDNLEMMLGYRIGPFMKISWSVTSPLFCLIIFIMSVVNYTELTYKRPSGTYVYPDWAVGVGWSMALVSAIFIPLVALFLIFKQSNAKEGLKALLEPKGLQSHQLRPQDYETAISYDLENISRQLPPQYTYYNSNPT